MRVALRGVLVTVQRTSEELLPAAGKVRLHDGVVLPLTAVAVTAALLFAPSTHAIAVV